MNKKYPRPLFLTHTKGNDDVIIFVDSGSPQNLISFSNYRKYFSHLPLKSVRHPPIADLHGNKLTIKGSISIEFLMNDLVWQEEVMVVENVKVCGHILLGFPAMLRNKIDIRASEKIICINGVKLKLYIPSNQDYEDISHFTEIHAENNSVDHKNEVRENKKRKSVLVNECQLKEFNEKTELNESVTRVDEEVREETNGIETNVCMNVQDESEVCNKGVYENVQDEIDVSEMDECEDVQNETQVCETVKEEDVREDAVERVLTTNEMLSKNEVTEVLADTNIVLKEGETMMIACKVNDAYEGKDVLILPEEERILGVSVVSSIDTVRNGRIFIEITNNRGSEIKICKGTFVCLCETYYFKIKVVQEMDENNDRIYSMVDGNDVEDLRRRKNIIENKLNNMDYPEARQELADLLYEYRDVVALEGDRLGSTTLIEHRIEVPVDSKPIYIPSYRLTHSQKEAVELEVNKMLNEDLIEPSRSPWNFPLLCVPKKDGTYRVVVDFRRLNKITVTDHYPMPSMKDLISNIGKRKIYSTIDLLSGFLQVPLDEQSRQMTAFNSSSGRFQYKRMPFGLKSSPATFVRLMDIVLHGLLGKQLNCYMDDLILGTDTLEEHLALLRKVLQRLREANLKLKFSKCLFFRKQLLYLGHTISEKGIMVNQDKCEAIQKFEPPTDKKSLRAFLGLSGFYRSFIKNYASIAAPLSDLLKENRAFIWGTSQEDAFNELKRRLTQPPVLAFPDFSKPFQLYTDACDYGIGGCLMQNIDGKRRPIAFFSRKLKKNEKDFSVTDKESLAIIDSLKKFRYIIYQYPITIFTDHAACTELFKNPNLSGKKARWFLLCQDYNADIKHIAGKTNVVADCLSRYPIEIQENSENIYTLIERKFDLSEETIAEEQGKDDKLKPIITFLRNQNDKRNIDLQNHFTIPIQNLKLIDNLLVRESKYELQDMMSTQLTQIVIPTILIPTVLEEIHDSRGHPGREESLRQTRMKYYWKTLFKDVSQYVKDCNKCAIHKGNAINNVALGAYPIPQRPFERISLDLLCNFYESNSGYKHLMVCVDGLTRYTEIIPLRTKTGKECALAFHDRILCRYTTPDVMITDNGTEFQNSFFQNLCNFYQIKKVNILPYRPQANGLVERTNRKIRDLMRQMIEPHDRNWNEKIPSIQFILNSSVHSSTKQSPHMALYGYQPRMPYESLRSKIEPVYTDDPIKTRINNSKTMFQKLRQNLEKAQILMKKNHDKNETDTEVKKGDIVYIYEDVRVGENYKMKPKFKGPYAVLEEKFGNKYLVESIDDPKQTRITHKDKIKLFKGKLHSTQMESESEEEEMVESIHLLFQSEENSSQVERSLRKIETLEKDLRPNEDIDCLDLNSLMQKITNRIKENGKISRRVKFSVRTEVLDYGRYDPPSELHLRDIYCKINGTKLI